MIESDFTITILQSFRDELARSSRETNQRLVGFKDQLDAMRAEREAARRESNLHFDALETGLRSVTEQMVTLSRVVKVAIEVRAALEQRLEDQERR